MISVDYSDSKDLSILFSTFQPLAVGSAPDVISPTPPGEENLNLGELEKEWNNAKALEEKAKNEMAEAEAKYQEKTKDAIEPNRVYDEKKMEWERLDKIATDTNGDYEQRKANANAARKEYNAATNALSRATENLAKAEKDLAESPDKIAAAQAKVDALKRVPANLTDSQARRTQKVDGKADLVHEVGRLEADAEAKNSTLLTAIGKKAAQQGLYDNGQCDAPSKQNTPSCNAMRTVLGQLDVAVGQAKTALGRATTALAGPQTELRNFDSDLSELERQIEDLESKRDTLDELVLIANSTVTRLQTIAPTLPGKVEAAKDSKRLAEADFTAKETAKNAAEAQLTGRSTEQEEANTSATNAELAMMQAAVVKDAINGEVEGAEKAWTKAKESHAVAQSTAESWRLRYETAKRKDEEAQKGYFFEFFPCFND